MKIKTFIAQYLLDVYLNFISDDLSYIKSPWRYGFQFSKFIRNILIWILAIIGFPIFYFILEFKINYEFYKIVFNNIYKHLWYDYLKFFGLL